MNQNIMDIKEDITTTVKHKTEALSDTVAEKARESQDKIAMKVLEASCVIDRAAEKVDSPKLERGLHRVSETVATAAEKIDDTDLGAVYQNAQRTVKTKHVMAAVGILGAGILAAKLTSAKSRDQQDIAVDQSPDTVEPIEVPEAVTEIEEYLAE